MTTEIYMLVAGVAVSLIGLITDFRSKRIPNALTFSAVAAGLMYHLTTGGSTMVLQSVEGMMLGLGLFMIAYLMGGMGAGDAKLVGALGAMLGPRAIVNVALFTAIAGGIYALGIIILRRESKNVIRNGINSLGVFVLTRDFSLLSTPTERGMPKLCYAAAIAAGTMLYAVLVLSGHKAIF